MPSTFETFNAKLFQCTADGWQIVSEPQVAYIRSYNEILITQQMKRYHPSWLEASVEESERFGLAVPESIVVE